MLFSNSEVLEWLNPHLAEEDLPNLVDFTELNSHAVSKEQGARKVTLVLDLDGMLLVLKDLLFFRTLLMFPRE